MQEIWDIYDVNRIKTGKTMVRATDFEEGSYHLVVNLCIFNQEGQMLIQQRQKDKEGFPNCWDVSVAGSALVGESSQEAIMRELQEELGISLDLSQSRPHFTINFDHGFEDIFLLRVKDLDLKTLSLQKEEVQAVAWASKEKILEMIDQGIFIPYYKSKIELCFDMLDKYGSHQ
ncbi:NUDIX hydrolase [Streptococcus catagoni]|uniref:NUDIX hydrolase n=1 Tax=Streptococcus catagoni TaxID=2654874 RepID=UPI0014076CDD|nr:NUDIX domain-containing protein [Streptococcus catagoni]